MIERNAGLSEPENFDYLMLGADDRAGALGFGRNVEPPAPRRTFNRTLDLERLQAAADAIVRDDPDFVDSAGQQVAELLLLATSMGGARPKTVVEDKGALWVAKFGRADDRWNHPRVEHGLLRLAQGCGLAVADSRVTTVGGRDVVLVRRFDRDRGKQGYRRHRMASALTLLRTEDSVAARGQWSYLLLADEVRRASAAPEADLRELFARMCFNAAVSNLDAILAKRRVGRLSPAFDLTPSPVVAVDRRDLAMAGGRHGRFANRTNLLSGHGRFLLAAEEAASVLDTIVQTVRAEWRATMRRAGASERDCEAIKGAFLYDGFFFEAAM